MSEMARWTYVNEVQVKPFLGIDRWGAPEYGPEYTIMCYYAAVSELTVGAGGEQFVSQHVIYCEDPRPKTRDLVFIPMVNEWQEVRANGGWPMEAFGDPMPDFKLVT